MRLVNPRTVWLAALPALGFLLTVHAADKPQPAARDFDKDVLPVLQTHCFKCHGANEQQAELDLRNRAALLRGGESGPAIVPGSAETSLLWIKIAADKMPPGKAKLTAAEKEVIRAWLESGAKSSGAAVTPETVADKPFTDAERRFWAFRKPVRPTVPEVKAKDRVRNSIDAFVVHSLENKGLSLSPDAERVVLLRRATFDLTGLPPTPAEVDAFLADQRPDAYERLLDRLLAIAALRRALGPALARLGRLRRLRGHPQRRLRPHGRVAVPRLRHPSVQQRQSLRPLPQGTARRR